MSQSKAFLSPSANEDEVTCFICCKAITKGQKSKNIGEKSFESFEAVAKEWSEINIPIQDEKHRFTEVYKRILDSSIGTRCSYVHAACKIVFLCNKERYLKKYGQRDDATVQYSDEGGLHWEKSPEKRATRSKHEPLPTKKVCFICNSQRKVDGNEYREGGLARCSSESTAAKLDDRKDIFLADKSNRFNLAAKRLH